MALNYINIKTDNIDANVPTKETLDIQGFTTWNTDNNIPVYHKSIEANNVFSYIEIDGDGHDYLDLGANYQDNNVDVSEFIKFTHQNENHSISIVAMSNNSVPSNYKSAGITLNFDSNANTHEIFIQANKLNLLCGETSNCPTPTTNTSIANKQYVDDTVANIKTATFTVVDL